MSKDHLHHWKDTLISPETDVMSAMKQLTLSSMRILLVVDAAQKLLGTVTDGDIRRYLLDHGSLDGNIEQVMRKNPCTALRSGTRAQFLAKMQKNSVLQLPIVDQNNVVVGLEVYEELSTSEIHDNWVVFMAGGLGKRLHPLTLECPKPLLKIGGKPILEVLLENCVKAGFRNFYFSVNYKSHMIQDHFGDGEKWGVNIRYIEETDELGTAGSLSLLPSRPDKPFFVVNADILTNMNFESILSFHLEQSGNALATVCVSQHQSTVPYGVVKIDEKNHQLLGIQEKPTQTNFINAGIYVLNPQALDYLTYNQYCDMPTFLLDLVKKEGHVSTFPICEYWLDIGHHENLSQAAADFVEVF